MLHARTPPATDFLTVDYPAPRNPAIWFQPGMLGDATIHSAIPPIIRPNRDGAPTRHRLGQYEITAQIGVGGMGEVYRVTGWVTTLAPMPGKDL